MSTVKISNQELIMYNDGEILELPKYVSQILNLANRNAQGTRPNVVGQLSDLFQQFLKEIPEPTIKKWEEWYLLKYPNAIDDATKKISNQLNNLKEAMYKINNEMIKSWVKDLVITKTYTGMYYQKAILKKISEIEKKEYRLATPEEESKGIDGFVGNIPLSIKPISYNFMNHLNEDIKVKIIKYKENEKGIEFEY